MADIDRDTIIANIRTYRAAASEENVRDGQAWYPAMLSIMRAHAADTGLSVLDCAMVYAAASINTSWDRNIALASGALADYAAGNEVYANGGTLIMTVEKTFGILTGTINLDNFVGDPDNYKIRCFSRNLSGDYEAVTVDRWALRAAHAFADCPNGGEPCKRNGKHGCGYVPTGAEYLAIADAYRIVAAEFDETPAATQAIVWCVVRGSGD